MPVYIPPNRNLTPASSDSSGNYTKQEADARFVHNFSNEVINGTKIFINSPIFNNGIKLVGYNNNEILTVDVSGDVISSGLDIQNLTYKSSSDAISANLSLEISNRINYDAYLQQQINEVSSAQYLIFSEQMTGNGNSTQFQLTGNITNAQFISGGWNILNVQNSLPSNITDINGKSIYDAGILYLFTRHKINIVSISGNAVVNLDYIPQNNEIFKLWYWYSLSGFDRIDHYYRDDFVAKMEEVSGELATGTVVNTVSFNNILSPFDNTVQNALNTIDSKVILKSEVSNVSAGLQKQIFSVSESLSGYANSTTLTSLTGSLQSQINLNSLVTIGQQTTLSQLAAISGNYINNSTISALSGQLTLLTTTNNLTGYLQSQINNNYILLVSVSGSIVANDIIQDAAMSGALISYTNSASANAYNQSIIYTNNISGNISVQEQKVKSINKTLIYDISGNLERIDTSYGSKILIYSEGLLIGISGTGEYQSKIFTYDISGNLYHISV